jgi:hypothetical protein
MLQEMEREGMNEEEADVEDDSPPQDTVMLSSIELENLLDKKDYRTFRDKLKLPSDLEDSDDLEIMVQLSEAKGNGNIGAKTLFKNMFNVLCCLAGESLDSNPMQSNDQLLNFSVKFTFWLENIELKEEFAETLLRFFPNRKLPPSFVQYVSTMYTTPTAKWIKDQRVQNKSPEQQKQIKFGSIVKSHYDLCKKELNGTANPLWISPSKLPSGVSMYAYMVFMRKQIWPARAYDLAENAVRQAFKRDNPSATYSKKDHAAIIQGKAALNVFDMHWFPDWWLPFVFLGLPAGNNARDSFNSGKAVTSSATLRDIRDLQTKVNRNAIDKNTPGSTPSTKKSPGDVPSSSSPSKRRKLDITVTSKDTVHSHISQVVQNRKQRIEGMKDCLETLKMLGFSVTDDKFKDVLNRLLTEQEQLVNDLAKAVDNNEFETPDK